MKLKTDAILMASGFSRRFGGSNKLLAPFKGRPLVCRTLELACSSSLFDNNIFVYHEPALAAIAREYPVQCVFNSAPGTGTASSIRLGVEASTADQYLFFTCDQPLLSPPVLEKLIKNGTENTILRPTYYSSPGSPVLFSACFREELLALTDEQRGKTVLTRHPGQVRTMPINDPFALWDADTPAMLRLLEQIADFLESSAGS